MPDNIDFAKIPPAPWVVDDAEPKELIAGDELIARGGPNTLRFAAMSRNAEDVMVRRKIHAQFYKDMNAWGVVDWAFPDGMITAPHPFLAILKADEFYKNHTGLDPLNG